MGRKLGEAVPPPFLGGAGSPTNTMSLWPRPTSIPSGTLMAVWPQYAWAENWGAPFWGSWVPSNTKSPGPRPTFTPSGILIHTAIWPQQIWGLCPFGGWGAGPHLRQCGRAESTCTPSFMLIHSTVWSQYTNVTDRTGQDTQHIQTYN